MNLKSRWAGFSFAIFNLARRSLSPQPSLITVSSLSALSHRLSQTSSSCFKQTGTYREVQAEREGQVKMRGRQSKRDRDRGGNNYFDGRKMRQRGWQGQKGQVESVSAADSSVTVITSIPILPLFLISQVCFIWHKTTFWYNSGTHYI